MHAHSNSLPPAVAVFFPALFIVGWILISMFIGAMSGWQTLARQFLKQSEPYGPTKTAGPFFYSVYTRYWSHYSSVIRMTAADDALYLSVLFLFRAGHPPLRIPWSEIRASKVDWFWRTLVELKLGNQDQIPMRISQQMARNLGLFDHVLGGNLQPVGPNFDHLSDQSVQTQMKEPLE